MPEIEAVADFVSFDDEVECMQQDAHSLSGILSQICETTEPTGDDVDENAELSFTSVTSEAPDDHSPRDARRALKTLQSCASRNFFGVGAMDASMKLEICMTDAKIEGTRSFESALPE